MLTSEQLQKIEQDTMQAIQSGLDVGESEWYAAGEIRGACGSLVTVRDDAHIANCDPQTVLELVKMARLSMPEKPTSAMLDALRTGSRKDWPSDELCAVRYAALRAAIEGERG